MLGPELCENVLEFLYVRGFELDELYEPGDARIVSSQLLFPGRGIEHETPSRHHSFE
jgi:hypothetical protein